MGVLLVSILLPDVLAHVLRQQRLSAWWECRVTSQISISLQFVAADYISSMTPMACFMNLLSWLRVLLHLLLLLLRRLLLMLLNWLLLCLLLGLGVA